ncbi:MAG: YceI family protein [Gammaproteobacteria bacterium]|jgi:polyisoprenoid-binding protein YceI|nr:YceI family protein [Gammaproteobacteria bacterium]MBP6052322.1 YceI family protein [Pseudomonadales bacterium]MBK6584772.1 YceI family protein [Gammaproteobacteria bacterium]MBK7519717.1 YceI family protein [Gammaproteobacteria bacterium]MBK7731036.1 YceI family protein [Gammaproteobacteria bacterium]
MRRPIIAIALLLGCASAGALERYLIDTEGMHAAIEFRIQHLGYSWLSGRFNTFSGWFEFDPALVGSKVEVLIDTRSIDSNHAERDEHLQGVDFLDVTRFPEARFVGTRVEAGEGGRFALHGDLTLHGVTRAVVIDAREIGSGADPWGGFRRGFDGSTTLKLADFGIDFDLGPAAREVQLRLSVEGVRQP